MTFEIKFTVFLKGVMSDGDTASWVLPVLFGGATEVDIKPPTSRYWVRGSTNRPMCSPKREI